MNGKLPTGMPLPPMEMSVLRIHTDEGIEGNTFISPPGPDVDGSDHQAGEADAAGS